MNAIPPIAVLMIAVAVTALATPFAAMLARRLDLVARPRGDRWHSRATPLLGGAAMAMGVVGSTFPLVHVPFVSAVLVAGALAFALGLVDDVRRIAPTTKLVGQILVASTLFFSGVRVELVEFVPLSFLLTVLWVVGLMNALNLIDNMDGLAAGSTAIAAGALAIISYPEAPTAALLALATAGSALGFLAYNRPPARIFMGDAGSQLLGLLLAASALVGTTAGATNVGLTVVGPLLVLALPMFDTALVAVSRRLAGRPVSQGGRDHSSHRLVRLGLDDRAAVLVLYGITAALALVGILIDRAGGVALPAVVLVVVALGLFGTFLHEVDVYGPTTRSAPSDEAPLLRMLGTYGRFGFEVGMDACLLTAAYYCAFLIRFDQVAPTAWEHVFAATVPFIAAGQLVALVVSGTYRTLWRYVGLGDALRLAAAVSVGTLVAALAISVVAPLGYSRGVFLIDALLAAVVLVGSRSFLLALQQWFGSRPRSGERRVLIVGANARGAAALRLLLSSTEPPHRVVGFLDDDPGKRHRAIAGVRVVGRTADLGAVMARLQADLVVLAIDESDAARVAEIRRQCQERGVRFSQVLSGVDAVLR